MRKHQRRKVFVMKKFASLALLLALGTFTVGCEKKATEPATTEPAATEPAATEPAATEPAAEPAK
jgi:hypothetical protein